MNPQVIIHPVPPATPATPAYVEHGGEISNRHPAAATNARLYGFVLEADRDLINDWCDVCFNEPSGGAEMWHAVGDHLLLAFIDIPALRSTDPLDAQLGSTPEHEVGLWMPVLDERRVRTAWAVPYIWVDSGLAMAGGRETYGFPKQLGSPHIPRLEEEPGLLSLDVVTLETFSPVATAVPVRVVTAERPKGDETEPLDDTWADPADALGHLLRRPLDRATITRRFSDPVGALEEFAGDVGVAVMLFAQMVNKKVPMVLLKQFRDAARPGCACYQGIIEVANTVSQFRRGGFLRDGYEVTFPPVAGQPVRRELGLISQSAKVAFWMEFDFTVHLGAVLWEATGWRAW